MDRRHVFSLSAPTHPVNPMTKIIIPTIIKMNAGSKARWVSLAIPFETLSFSLIAQKPTDKTHRPKNCK